MRFEWQLQRNFIFKHLEDIMPELRAGRAVKRKCWKGAYLFLGKDTDDKTVATSCILGEDWEAVEG